MSYLNQLNQIGTIQNCSSNEKIVLNTNGPLSTKNAKNAGVLGFGMSASSSTTAAANRHKLTQNAFGINFPQQVSRNS